MATIKILIGLFLTTLLACNNSTTQSGKQIIDKRTEENSASSLTLLNGHYQIDTALILSNKNLLPLIGKLEKEQLTAKKTVSEIPIFIKSFLDSLTADFSIANSGEDWRAGCTSSMEIDYSSQKKSIDPKTGDTLITVSMKNKDVPSRQLIYLGLGKNIALMAYYTGGFGRSEHVLIFEFTNEKIIDFWCGNTLTDLMNEATILKYLNDNKDKEWGLNTNILYL